MHLLPKRPGMSDEVVAASIQNFAICIEMYFAGLAHHWIFSCADFYSEDPSVRTPRLQMLESMAAFDEAHPGWEARSKGSGSIGETAYGVEEARMYSASKSLGSAEGGSSSSSGRASESVGESAGGGGGEVLVPMSYGEALRGMMPMDVIKDTGTLVSGGFGMAHKWEKRGREERARVHEMSQGVGAPPVPARPAGGGAGLGSAPGSGPGAAAVTPARKGKHFGRFSQQQQQQQQQEREQV